MPIFGHFWPEVQDASGLAKILTARGPVYIATLAAGPGPGAERKAGSGTGKSWSFLVIFGLKLIEI